MLIEAAQPEILRAAQRDDAFKKHLAENVSEILRLCFGASFWIKYKDLTVGLVKVLYQLMTTMSNIQTLGEEYTGMVQVDASKKTLPKKYLQFLMILLNNYGEKAVIETLKKIETLSDELPITHSAQTELRKMSSILRTCLPLILKFHKGLFYVNGHYYEISKRICGTKYVLVRYWLKDRSSPFAFKLLGFITLIQSILSLLSVFCNYNDISEEKISESKSESVDACNKCPLCLNTRQNTSVIPCGHLFCWSCIILWLQEKPKCPLCRNVTQPSRVVFLQNCSSFSYSYKNSSLYYF